MQLEKNYIYHIYNQGNNRRKIFYIRDNYLFFIEKIRTYVIPYADIFAWCLMPNHFHLMVYVREIELPATPNQGFTRSQHSQGFTPSETLTGTPPSETLTGRSRTFNDSIGIMLRSYTRAINKQENFTGSLFRKETKAECVNCPKGLAPAYLTKDGITKINVENPQKQYPQICFNYIHQNPLKAGLVNNPVEWEFSSAPEYAGLRNWELVNKNIAAEYVNLENRHI
jgi:putative transposase